MDVRSSEDCMPDAKIISSALGFMCFICDRFIYDSSGCLVGDENE